MPVTDRTDEELERMRQRYLASKKTEGGPYTLSEVSLELLRRKPCEFGVAELAKKIVELAAVSKDGFVTYGEIWKAFRPNIPWKANHSRKIVSNALSRVIYYCVHHKKAILTVLVVKQDTRSLSHEAVQNIYDECKNLGMEVGLDPRAFVEEQSVRARGTSIENLPNDLQ